MLPQKRNAPLIFSLSGLVPRYIISTGPDAPRPLTRNIALATSWQYNPGFSVFSWLRAMEQAVFAGSLKYVSFAQGAFFTGFHKAKSEQ